VGEEEWVIGVEVVEKGPHMLLSNPGVLLLLLEKVVVEGEGDLTSDWVEAVAAEDREVGGGRRTIGSRLTTTGEGGCGCTRVLLLLCLDGPYSVMTAGAGVPLLSVTVVHTFGGCCCCCGCCC